MSASHPRERELLATLLEEVSRSFYLTLRVLPKAIRPQIGLAYLLARASDTIADTEIIPLDQRLTALHKLRERILGTNTTPLDFGGLAREQGLPAERTLLERIEDSLALLNATSRADLQLIQQVLDIITSGQELDLRRFAGASAKRIIALQTDAQLDDYTYRVAGCVGEFWTRICRAHVLANAMLDDAALIANGIRFGKGLQLVNILRDLPKDLRLGRCYLPQEQLARAGLNPADLLDLKNISRLRPLYDSYLDVAAAHLDAARTYTMALPFGQVRLRIACAWPILIGNDTLRKLRTANILDASQRVKVSRAEVRQIVTRTLVWYPWPSKWSKLLQP